MSMCFLSSPDDDAPTAPTREVLPTLNDLHRERDGLHAHAGNVMRMLDGYRNGGSGYTPAVRRMTLNAAKNAVEAYLKTLDGIEAEVLPKPVTPRVPRYSNADLPAVASAEVA